MPINDKMSPSLSRIQADLDKLPQQAYEVFVKATPKDKGNARRQTKLVDNQIQAKYAYARRLDEGYSKQAPDGMTKPTERFIQTRLKKIMKK